MEEKMESKLEVDLTTGNLFKKIFVVAMPLMLSGILQLLYTAADLIVCGNYGSSHSVAAISSTNALNNLIVQIFLGFSVGANVLMARTYGAKDREKCTRVAHTAILLSVIVGIILSIFGMIFARDFLILMDNPEEIIDLSHAYLFIIFMGLPFSMVYNFGSALMRAVGDTKRPFIILALSGIINVLLNLFLVIVCHLDVKGVAIATIVSQAISAILVIICLVKSDGYTHISLKELKLHKHEVKEIIMIGFPAGLEGVIFSLSNVIIQSSVNSLGTIVMDANGASSSIEGFVFTCMNSIAQTNLAFVSANYGAHKFENIKKSILSSCIIILGINLVLGSILYFFGDDLIKLYLNGEQENVNMAVQIGMERIKIFACLYWICGIMNTVTFTLRGIGYNIVPTLISLIGVCGIRILWVYLIFPLEQFHSLRGLVISYPLSWIITLGVLIIFYLIFKNKAFSKIEKSNL